MILKFKTGFSHLAQETSLVVLHFYDSTSYVYIPIYVPNLHLVWSIFKLLKNINKFVIGLTPSIFKLVFLKMKFIIEVRTHYKIGRRLQPIETEI